MPIILPDEFLQIGDENFPITVDYTNPLDAAYSEAVKLVRWHGNIKLRCRIPIKRKGEFTCYYAILQKDVNLHWNMRKAFERLNIVAADTMQIFAFMQRYLQSEVTKEKPMPILAAAPESTWLCSHESLNEMIGIAWSYFYHAPGPCLSTHSSISFYKGTRFLAIRQ